MIEEVLKNVKEAEKRAEDMLNSANKQAADIKSAADDHCAEMLKNAKKEAREAYDKAIEEAHKFAEEHFESDLSDCKKAGEKLKHSLDKKVDELSKDIYGRIVNGGC